jgi:hypothetical protein
LQYSDFFDGTLPWTRQMLAQPIENDCIQSAMYMALADTKVEFISAKLDDINKTKQGYCLNLNDCHDAL